MNEYQKEIERWEREHPKGTKYKIFYSVDKKTAKIKVTFPDSRVEWYTARV